MASSNEPGITTASFFIILEKFSLVSSNNISDLRDIIICHKKSLPNKLIILLGE